MEPAEGDADEGDVLRLRGGAPSNSNQNAASDLATRTKLPLLFMPLKLIAPLPRMQPHLLNLL
jgi:hypothetical protein